ncbi:MAG: hypothetical protein Kow00120_08810 [Anaerolineae bacterium]
MDETTPAQNRLQFRAVGPDDVDALHAACLADWPRYEVERVVQLALRVARDRRGVGVIAAREAGDGAPVGFGLLTLWPHAAEVSDLTVAPALRGQGIGTALLRHLECAARAMQAERLEIGVAARNTRALALYRRLGFVEDRRVELDLGEGTEVVLYLSKALGQEVT